MTAMVHADYTVRILPGIKRTARKRFWRARDSEDKIADFVAKSWEAYLALSKHGHRPSLQSVLRRMHAGHVKSNDLLDRLRKKLNSMSVPSVRREVEAIPA